MLTMGGSPGALTVLNVDQYEFQGMKMHSAPNRMLTTEGWTDSERVWKCIRLLSVVDIKYQSNRVTTPVTGNSRRLASSNFNFNLFKFSPSCPVPAFVLVAPTYPYDLLRHHDA